MMAVTALQAQNITGTWQGTRLDGKDGVPCGQWQL
jgi:hypothetical protein